MTDGAALALGSPPSESSSLHPLSTSAPASPAAAHHIRLRATRAYVAEVTASPQDERSVGTTRSKLPGSNRHQNAPRRAAAHHDDLRTPGR
ncbi:hypothetical protein Stsp02_46740 [Streptomyces sp. NBRC 14336]|nr:hypothetical protein Stsp02_46740 [Streptomyces sp. NBRC 14336]